MDVSGRGHPHPPGPEGPGQPPGEFRHPVQHQLRVGLRQQFLARVDARKRHVRPALVLNHQDVGAARAHAVVPPNHGLPKMGLVPQQLVPRHAHALAIAHRRVGPPLRDLQGQFPRPRRLHEFQASRPAVVSVEDLPHVPQGLPRQLLVNPVHFDPRVQGRGLDREPRKHVLHRRPSVGGQKGLGLGPFEILKLPCQSFHGLGPGQLFVPVGPQRGLHPFDQGLAHAHGGGQFAPHQAFVARTVRGLGGQEHFLHVIPQAVGREIPQSDQGVGRVQVRRSGAPPRPSGENGQKFLLVFRAAQEPLGPGAEQLPPLRLGGRAGRRFLGSRDEGFPDLQVHRRAGQKAPFPPGHREFKGRETGFFQRRQIPGPIRKPFVEVEVIPRRGRRCGRKQILERHAQEGAFFLLPGQMSPAKAVRQTGDFPGQGVDAPLLFAPGNVLFVDDGPVPNVDRHIVETDVVEIVEQGFPVLRQRDDFSPMETRGQQIFDGVGGPNAPLRRDFHKSRPLFLGVQIPVRQDGDPAQKKPRVGPLAREGRRDRLGPKRRVPFGGPQHVGQTIHQRRPFLGGQNGLSQGGQSILNIGQRLGLTREGQHDRQGRFVVPQDDRFGRQGVQTLQKIVGGRERPGQNAGGLLQQPFNPLGPGFGPPAQFR